MNSLYKPYVAFYGLIKRALFVYLECHLLEFLGSLLFFPVTHFVIRVLIEYPFSCSGNDIKFML